MTPTPPHTKVKTVKSYTSGRIEIDSHSMHNDLSSVKQEIGQSVETSRATLIPDLIAAAVHITSGETAELDIKIVTNKKTGEPERIIKTWLVHKEHYGK